MIDQAAVFLSLTGGLAKFAWDKTKEALKEGAIVVATEQTARIAEAAMGKELTHLAENHVRQFRERLSGARKIAENHDIVHALRVAELDAIDYVVFKFEALDPHNPPVRLLRQIRRGLRKARTQAKRISWDESQHLAMLASFEQAFTGSAVRIEKQLDAATLQATEVAWAELRSWTDAPPPKLLESRFFGEQPGPVSWFEAYCGNVAEELKQPESRMREAFFAGKLVEIGGGVVEGRAILDRIEATTNALRLDMRAAGLHLSDLRRQGARTERKLNETSRKLDSVHNILARQRASHGPFLTIQRVLEQDETRLAPGIFPRIEDYEKGRVHAPSVLGAVESALTSQNSALVVGLGASGKTTLAKVLAYRPMFRPGQVYYLDLTASSLDAALAERAIEAITAAGDPGVLFVVDNAHLDPTGAFAIWHHWLTFNSGSRLLVLTRRIRESRDVWDASPEVEAMKLPRFELIVQPGDLLGVYGRLVSAQTRIEAPAVAPTTIRQWERLFGGDLMMFSVAVLGCIARGGDAETLGPEDAHAYVRSKYFETLETELDVLLDLAAIAEVEGLAPVEAFAAKAFKSSIKMGLVWVETRGNRTRPFRGYRLCHPGLGTIFRDAAGIAETSLQDRIRVLQAHPFAGAALAFKLHRAGADSEAKDLMAAIWSNSTWPMEAIGLSWWRNLITLAQKYDLVDGAEITRRANAWIQSPEARERLVREALTTAPNFLGAFLSYADVAFPEVAKIIRKGFAANPEKVTALVLGAPLGFLKSFFTYLEGEMPMVAGVIRSGLASNPERLVASALAMPLGDVGPLLAYSEVSMPEVADMVRKSLAEHPDRLGAQALVTPLGDLGSFLAYADIKMAKVASTVRASLADHQDKLRTQALITPLEDLGSFLTYADTKMPEIASIVRSSLSENPVAVVDLALRAPLEHLGSFLTYADTKMPEVASIVRSSLSENPDAVVDLALRAPLEHLGSFLTYTQTAMPEVATALLEALTAPSTIEEWAKCFVRDGPEKIVGLGRHESAVLKVLPFVNVKAWRDNWERTRHGQPSWIARFARLCHTAGRADLLGITAGAVIRTAQPEDFPPPGINLRHVAAVLAAPHDCGPSEVDTLFGRCLPPGWLATQYRTSAAHTGALGGALRRIALDERPWLRSHFCHADLARRLEADQPDGRRGAAPASSWLGLLSAVCLLQDSNLSLRATDPALINAALNEWPPGPPDQGVQAIQAGLWAGLREWRRLTGQDLKVDPSLGNAILAQFRVADPVGQPRRVALNVIMIDWLERCKSQDWALVADRSTLKQAMDDQLQPI